MYVSERLVKEERKRFAKVEKAGVHEVFESVAAGYDAANDRISLGRHHAWKRSLVAFALNACDKAVHALSDDAKEAAPAILDVCCGTGDVVEAIARERPDILVVGLDFSSGMLEVARRRLAGLGNVLLIEGNAMELPFDDDAFGAATISFGLRNTPDYGQVLAEMRRVVRAGGGVACLDASVPDNPLVLPFYRFYYRHVMTLLGGGIEKHREYEWLYRSTQEFLRKDELAALFEDSGLAELSSRSFLFGAAALHTGVKA